MLVHVYLCFVCLLLSNCWKIILVCVCVCVGLNIYLWLFYSYVYTGVCLFVCFANHLFYWLLDVRLSQSLCFAPALSFVAVRVDVFLSETGMSVACYFYDCGFYRVSASTDFS